MLHVQDIFFELYKTWLPWASLYRKRSHLHAGSHVKPRGVKMCMQMGAGRKEHKKTNVGQWQWVFCFAFATVFCFGQELISREAEFSLKRLGEENYWIWKGSFFSLRDTTTTLFGTITLKSILIWSSITNSGARYGSNNSVWKLLVLKKVFKKF